MNFAEACEKGEFYTVLRNVDLKNLELDEGMQKLLKMVTKKQTLAATDLDWAMRWAAKNGHENIVRLCKDFGANLDEAIE